MRKKDIVPGWRVSIVRDAGPECIGTHLVTPAQVADVVRGVIPRGEEREYFVAIYLTVGDNVKGVSIISIGTLSSSLVHPREVFRPAIVAGAAGIIVAHNHPSGNTSPSAEDQQCTKRLRRAGEIIGIQLVDHVIISDEGRIYSFRESGLL